MPATLPTTRQVYLDYNATTPLAPEVMDAMRRHLTTYGNPSSLHAIGEEARACVEHARQQVAELLHTAPEHIVFNGGGSESINTAIKGIALAHSGQRCHIITSQIEHAATLGTCGFLETLGYDVTYLPVDGDGRVDPASVRAALRPTTRLITIMHANNEIGVIQPIEEIGAIAHEADVLFHTDAVQTVGKRDLNLSQLPVDLLSLTAHKFYGPKGIGALVTRLGHAIQPLVHGGGQEQGLRGGTENVLGIIGLGAACELARTTLADPESLALRQQLRDHLYEGLSVIPDMRINGNLAYTVPGTLNVSFRGIKGDALLNALAFQGIAISTGSACHASLRKASHVLVALGTPEEWLPGSVRFSLGRHTTADDIEYVIATVRTVVQRLRAMSPLAKVA